MQSHGSNFRRAYHRRILVYEGNLRRWVYFFSKKHGLLSFSIIYWAFFTLIAYLLHKNLPDTELPADLTAISLALGGFYGAVLVLIFSIRMLFIQNASTQVISGYYSFVIKDRVTSFVLLFIFVMTISLFLIALIGP